MNLPFEILFNEMLFKKSIKPHYDIKDRSVTNLLIVEALISPNDIDKNKSLRKYYGLTLCDIAWFLEFLGLDVNPYDIDTINDIEKVRYSNP